MSIYGALSSAVSGLRAQAHALENISGNIANSQTTAYKRIETDFLDLIPDAPLKRQVPGSVLAQSRGTNDVAGDIREASSGTFIALNASGFFVVEPKVGQSDGNAVFANTNFYTRRGDFEIDKDGMLVNGAGYYLKGLPVDRSSGNVSGTVPEVIKLSNAFLPAQQTGRIQYQANLPQIPKTANYDASVANSELLDVTDFGGTAGTQLATIDAEDDAAFQASSVAGGAITVFAANGSPVPVVMRWAKVDSAAQGTGHADTWNLFYTSDTAATGTEPKWTNVGQDYTFGANGSLVPPGVESVELTNLTINGVAVGDVTLAHGQAGISQFADANGTVSTSVVSQDGYAAGDFLSVAVNDSGRVVATYSNGKRIDVAQVVTVDFNGVNSLKRLDGGVYQATSESGDGVLDLTGTGIIGGYLEASNTDISDEFTKLIVTQQAYSANTRIVTTADEMLQEALNMVR